MKIRKCLKSLKQKQPYKRVNVEIVGRIDLMKAILAANSKEEFIIAKNLSNLLTQTVRKETNHYTKMIKIPTIGLQNEISFIKSQIN